MPAELFWARTVVGLAQRFGVLPSAVLAEPSSTLRMLELLDADCGKAET